MKILLVLCLLALLIGCPEPPGGTFPDDDDGCDQIAAWLDLDGDGWGGEDVSACEPPDGYVEQGGDCDDEDPARSPGADESCDGIDNDCDGEVPVDEWDEDNDWFAVCEGDCDDASWAINPGAEEICDGLDTDCDPLTDEAADEDGDGASLCDGDCDDGEPAVGPGAVDVCDGTDNDCDGDVDSGLGMTVTVPGDCAELQWALDAAPEGATVQLGAGTWDCPCLRDGAAIHLRGVDGATRTLVDAGGVGTPALTLNDAGSSTVSAVTFTGGETGLSSIGTHLALDSVIARGNDGQGIHVIGGSLVANHVLSAGNAHSGLQLLSTEAAIAWSILAGNADTEQGAGLYLASSEVTLSWSAVVGNTAVGGGGGIASILSELEVTGSVIWANDAAEGGGVYAEPPNDPDLWITWSNIQGNGPDDLDPDPGWPDAFDGGISVAPAFLGVDVDGDPMTWDLHISAASANVDAGPPSSLDPDGSPADIGPFGGPGADDWDLDGDGWPLWWQPGPYVPGSYDCDDLDPDVHPGAGC